MQVNDSIEKCPDISTVGSADLFGFLYDAMEVLPGRTVAKKLSQFTR